ncbi:MAG: hypothetical protein KKF44_00365 [Nanoarchaeota archaeon]|nr:hypothetical protein [Nanoarchaeota archaeon]
MLCSLLLLSSCDSLEKMMEDLMVSIKITMTAKILGTWPMCPSDKPYKIGGLGGVCVDAFGLADFVGIRLQGTIPEEEKAFLLIQRARLFGDKKNCPPDKPYFKRTFLTWGNCLSQKEFDNELISQVDDWKKVEEERGRTRLLGNTQYCDKGHFYDTHTHECLDPTYCNEFKNAYFNKESGNCECKDGYGWGEDDCDKIPETKECYYDNECHISKGKPKCSGTTKIIPRCNARTYTCWVESVECKESFGANAICDPAKVQCVNPSEES